MMKRSGLLLPALLLAGCAVKVTEPVQVELQQPVQVTLAPDSPRLPAADQPALATLPSGPLGLPVRQMAEQIDASLRQRGIKTLPIAISPFVDLDQPAAHRGFGDQLAEGFYHELQARGYNLIDHRALPFGEGAAGLTSPALSDYYRQHRISYVLSGTFSAQGDGVTVNARMFDTITQQVVATGQSQIGLQALEGGLPGYSPFSSRDGMIIENGGVPLQ
ncbi:FlgO family outer membrane protein [Motiliproteus sediminis]|uniref:FlgO family outer membrane protein n=1 Tax=Motiliproteus sediminis TaxID=1468178 RepID=UPI001AEFD3ED|nr:FlgO family outer membrane protein [Motiliproteus sediminis]